MNDDRLITLLYHLMSSIDDLDYTLLIKGNQLIITIDLCHEMDKVL